MKDESGFTEFVRERGDGLTRTAWLLIPDRGDAEDAVQTALLRLSRRWPVDAPTAYARPILVNLAKDRSRRRHLVPERTPVVLRVIEGLSEAQTAAAMKCSTGTVKSNLSHGLARLRELLPEGAPQ